jgi:hypothetical protein
MISDEERADLIHHRLKRAGETIEEADVLLRVPINYPER